MRDRLIELLNDSFAEQYEKRCLLTAQHTADRLLAAGVVVPPCKVGDKTYLLLEKLKGGYAIVVSKCVEISENENGKWFSMYIDCVDIGNSIEFQSDDFGKTVFLTKEEAEKALERSEG